MPKVQRTPPKTPIPGQSQSVPDIASAASSSEDSRNVTLRNRRQCIEDSSNELVMHSSSSCACGESKEELMQLLNSWKTDYDRRLSTWKSEHDAILSTLVKDVNDLKNLCAGIQNSATELQISMNTFNINLERTKVTMLGQDKQYEELPELTSRSSLVTTNSPMRLPPNERESLVTMASVGEKAVDLVTGQQSRRDIRIPTKPVTAAAGQRQMPKPQVLLPVSAAPAVATGNVSMGDEVLNGQTNDDDWVEVRHRRPRRSLSNVMRGTAAPGTTRLEASERWRYLHLFYVKQGTTDSQVREHLHTICGTDVCTVEVLKSRGNYASFKLGVPSKLADQVSAVQNWAEDICVKPWRHNFRARNSEQLSHRHSCHQPAHPQ